MPQSSRRLRKKFLKGNDDGIGKCEAILAKYGLPVKGNGLIVVPDTGIPEQKLTRELEDAVDYLCDEWDYAVISETEASKE